jgi:hypothetical protein
MRKLKVCLTLGAVLIGGNALAADLSFFKQDKAIAFNGTRKLYYYEGDASGGERCLVMLQVSGEGDNAKLTSAANAVFDLISTPRDSRESNTYEASDIDSQHLRVNLEHRMNLGIVESIAVGGNRTWDAQMDLIKDSSGKLSNFSVQATFPFWEWALYINANDRAARCENLKNYSGLEDVDPAFRSDVERLIQGFSRFGNPEGMTEVVPAVATRTKKATSAAPLSSGASDALVNEVQTSNLK